MTPDQHLWACAVEVERQHGDASARYAEDRISALAAENDHLGVATWLAIADHLKALRQGAKGPRH